jgi:hypothetical protein
MQFKELINYGSLACIVGVLPALAGSLGKMKDHNCVGNTCGVLSLFSTTILSVGATGFVAVYMTFLGAYIHLGCSTIQTMYADYENDSTCNEECLAAQKHLVDAICNLGKGFGATGMLMFLSAVLGLLTTIMVCVGFCNNKKQEDAIQAVVVVPQSAPPVAQAVNVKY